MCGRVGECTHTHTHTHTQTQTHTHTHIHTYTDTDTHTCTHTKGAIENVPTHPNAIFWAGYGQKCSQMFQYDEVKARLKRSAGKNSQKSAPGLGFRFEGEGFRFKVEGFRFEG